MASLHLTTHGAQHIMSSTSELLDTIRRAIQESNGEQGEFLKSLILSETVTNLVDRVEALEKKAARLEDRIVELETNPSLVWLFRFKTFPTVTTVLIITFLLLIVYLSGGLERLIALL